MLFIEGEKMGGEMGEMEGRETVIGAMSGTLSGSFDPFSVLFFVCFTFSL